MIIIKIQFLGDNRGVFWFGSLKSQEKEYELLQEDSIESSSSSTAARDSMVLSEYSRNNFSFTTSVFRLSRVSMVLVF